MTAIQRVIDARDVRVVYQPVVDLQTGEVFAYEALVRPNAPEFKNPLDLFAAAVEHRATGALGRMIRELSVERCTEHPLFLNVHPAELNEGFIVQPDDPIFNHASDVYIEITEGVPLSHFALCQNMLSEVRGRGVYLVVDDLGAGYSNLAYIADLHPKVVKLDRELITNLRETSRRFTLVRAIVVLCRDLGAMVVAEGIETAEELAAVKAAGAHFGQGYFLARPAFPPPAVDPSLTWSQPARMRTQSLRRRVPTLRPLSERPRRRSKPPR